MENHCVNLLSEHFKQIFNEPNNKEALKYLISTFLNVPEEEMKERYKLRLVDKIENISNTMKLVQSFLDIMR